MPNETPPPATTPNAPNFASTETIAIAQQLSEIKQQLATITAERDALKADAAKKEEQMETNKVKEVQKQLDALKAENETTVKDAKTAEVQKELDALTAERDALKAERDSLQGEKTTTERKASLEGKVSSVDIALKLLDANKHLDAEGKIKLEALLTDYPTLAPTGPAGPTAPDGGGGVQRATVASLEKALEAKDATAINAAFDTELKGSE